jgi:hypothetical protein
MKDTYDQLTHRIENKPTMSIVNKIHRVIRWRHRKTTDYGTIRRILFDLVNR